MSKEFGLIIPGKNKQIVQAPGKRAAIFDEDSDTDEEAAPTKPIFAKKRENKQIKLTQDKLMQEDPTVYQYDEVYDDIEKKRTDSKLSRKDLERKPKYINNLLRAAERRKRDNELRIEREVHRERETEGDKFADKESYVTPSYLKKLEELKALEEEEKRQEYLETIGDVRKQGNLDGFYRHLYEQNVKNEDKSDSEPEINETIEKEPEENEHKNKLNKKRQYRTRDDSKSEDETIEVKKEHMPSNLDADSDFSIDSSDSEEDKVDKTKKIDEDVKVKEEPEEDKKEVVSGVDEKEIKKEEPVKKEEVKKPKIDIWKKRTVGEVFENARMRYFERLALRESG